MRDKVFWLQVARTEGIGPISFHAIRQRYPNPAQAMEYIRNKFMKQLASEESIREELEKTEAFGARIISFDDPKYPKLLKQIKSAPPFIVVKGKLDENANYISVVGSRNSSASANKIAFNLSEKLVECGYCIVSGLARGIDRHAHLGGIKNTVAVLGCGIDQIYPDENKDLYLRVMDEGALITEAPIGTAPAPHLFPARNRIIAGLSAGLVIVQATKYSGSLITAHCAGEYNRDLFAVPGCPLDPRSYGPNSLIKNGAALTQDHNDIIQQLSSYPIQEPIIDQTELEVTDEPENFDDNSIKDRILSHISSTPLSIDELQDQLSLPISHIRHTLVELELSDQIKYLVGDRVVRVY